MNTLAIIKRRIEKAEAKRRAQLSHVAYRGVPTRNSSWVTRDVHGSFTYRGVPYTK